MIPNNFHIKYECNELNLKAATVSAAINFNDNALSSSQTNQFVSSDTD